MTNLTTFREYQAYEGVSADNAASHNPMYNTNVYSSGDQNTPRQKVDLFPDHFFLMPLTN